MMDKRSDKIDDSLLMSKQIAGDLRSPKRVEEIEYV